MSIAQRHPGSRCAISSALLVVAFCAWLLVLHRAQPLAIAPGSLNPASFTVVKKVRYLVVVRGELTQPFTLSLRGPSGELLSHEDVGSPAPGRPDAPIWRTLKARADARDARVSVDGLAAAQITLGAIDENAPRRKWIATALLLAGFAGFAFAYWPRRWVQALAIGVGYFIFLLPWHLPAFFSATGDNEFYVPSGLSLLERGDWNVDEFGGPNPSAFFAKTYNVMRGKDGHFYNLYPPGTTVLALPIIALGDWLMDRVPDAVERGRLIAELAAKIISAATVALFFATLISLTRRVGLSWTLTCAFAFATPQLATHGGGLWSHNASTFLSVLAIGLWVWKEGRLAAWSALPLTLGMICRPTMLVPAAVFGCALLLLDRKRFALFAGLVCLGLTAFVIHSLGIWGHLLPPYYTGHAEAPGSGAAGYFGTLISPNRGLLIYCPLICFSLVGGVIALRRGGLPIYRMAGVVCLLEWILASHNTLWWGGHCYGPRLLCEAREGAPF